MGLRIIASGEELKDFYVSEIIPDSPAAKAGIKVGDEIIAINGKPVFFFKYSQINAILRANPKTKTKLILSRKGVLIEIKLKHQRLI
jgi:C-terminal processing protease CtpA/Prc